MVDFGVDFGFIRDNWMFVASGIGATLGVSVLSLLLAVPLAFIVGAGRRSTFLPISALSMLYVALIDATPLLLQIFFIFLALPQLVIILSGFWTGVLVLGVNYGAHMSEAVRVSFASAGKSQPAVMQSLIPLLGIEFIALIRDSTLLSVAGLLQDVLWRATKLGRAEFKNLEALLIALVIYWVMTLIPSFILRMLKNRTLTIQSGTEGYG
jgi:His/Glu/Gln/Arg/opine family amino acid ABC transporter permease subunit